MFSVSLRNKVYLISVVFSFYREVSDRFVGTKMLQLGNTSNYVL